MTDTWADIRRDLTDTVARLSPGQFAIVEYDAGLPQLKPYAQTAREPDGYYVEVVSESYLPRNEWPILVRRLEHDGWIAPRTADENWFRCVVDDQHVAADALLRGLRDGRACRDPSLFDWRVGRFPPPPDGGEPLPITSAPARAA